ncbi:hypothetical protein HAL07_10590 [Helicobacter ailurogastricus]|uniref:Uncharacterized protein n=1 Tax=Helicobacter ailurogastricus TaxID=1578720 RepID=A0A0K2Y419_9HELI|nr:hypothetical protein HAL07_10590 [Helicobacter ailurogastricus]
MFAPIAKRGKDAIKATKHKGLALKTNTRSSHKIGFGG